MLQKFIDEGVINLSDDSHVSKLTKAANEVVKRLNKDKDKIIPYLLIGISANPAPDAPELLEVREIISKNWNTYTSVTKDSPLTLFRVVILEALRILSSEIEMSNLIYLASRNITKFTIISPGEKKIITPFLKQLSTNVSTEAISRYSSKNSSDKKTSTIVKVDEASLQKLLGLALSPTNSSNISRGEGANPLLPEDGVEWLDNLLPKLTKAISTTVNKVISDQDRSLNRQDDFMKLISLKTDILWWKFSGYSEFLLDNYKNIDTNLLPFVLAYDYSKFIDPIFPASVSYFLENMYQDIDSQNISVTFEEFLDGLANHGIILKDALLDKHEPTERKITLYQFLSFYINEKLDKNNFEEKMGIELSTEILKTDLCIWIFNDLQCEKILK